MPTIKVVLINIWVSEETIQKMMIVDLCWLLSRISRGVFTSTSGKLLKSQFTFLRKHPRGVLRTLSNI